MEKIAELARSPDFVMFLVDSGIIGDILHPLKLEQGYEIFREVLGKCRFPSAENQYKIDNAVFEVVRVLTGSLERDMETIETFLERAYDATTVLERKSFFNYSRDAFIRFRARLLALMFLESILSYSDIEGRSYYALDNLENIRRFGSLVSMSRMFVFDRGMAEGLTDIDMLREEWTLPARLGELLQEGKFYDEEHVERIQKTFLRLTVFLFTKTLPFCYYAHVPMSEMYYYFLSSIESVEIFPQMELEIQGNLKNLSDAMFKGDIIRAFDFYGRIARYVMFYAFMSAEERMELDKPDNIKKPFRLLFRRVGCKIYEMYPHKEIATMLSLVRDADAEQERGNRVVKDEQNGL